MYRYTIRGKKVGSIFISDIVIRTLGTIHEFKHIPDMKKLKIVQVLAKHDILFGYVDDILIIPEHYEVLEGVRNFKNDFFNTGNTWIKFDGEIFCDSGCTQKYTTIDDLEDELILIGKSIPYISMEINLYTSENSFIKSILLDGPNLKSSRNMFGKYDPVVLCSKPTQKDVNIEEFDNALARYWKNRRVIVTFNDITSKDTQKDTIVIVDKHLKHALKKMIQMNLHVRTGLKYSELETLLEEVWYSYSSLSYKDRITLSVALAPTEDVDKN